MATVKTLTDGALVLVSSLKSSCAADVNIHAEGGSFQINMAEFVPPLSQQTNLLYFTLSCFFNAHYRRNESGYLLNKRTICSYKTPSKQRKDETGAVLTSVPQVAFHPLVRGGGGGLEEDH